MEEQENAGPREEPRINNTSAALMIGTAALCDLLGPFGTVGGPVVFFIWFKNKGVPVISTKQVGKQLANLGLNAVGEVATGGIWVGVTVGVIITIVLSRVEDKLGVSLDMKSNLENPTQLAESLKRKSAPSGQGAVNDNKPVMSDMKSTSTGNSAGPSKPGTSENDLPLSEAA
jgi:hypothetical protein